MIIYKVLSVALGGFIGSILRYEISSYASKKADGSFPYGTICVNNIGSFLLGAIVSFNSILEINQYVFVFLTTGFAGAFTTFSTAMYELYRLIEGKEVKHAVLYFVLAMVGGIITTISGYWTCKLLLSVL